MGGCLFCEVAAGERPADVVGETKEVLAFRDVNPVAPTHVLLIPKRHVESAARLAEGDQELLGELFGLATRIAADEGLDGWRLLTNVGSSGGQAVMHLHFHLLGGRQMGWPPG